MDESPDHQPRPPELLEGKARRSAIIRNALIFGVPMAIFWSIVNRNPIGGVLFGVLTGLVWSWGMTWWAERQLRKPPGVRRYGIRSPYNNPSRPRDDPDAPDA